jgi:hypothetical protein
VNLLKLVVCTDPYERSEVGEGKYDAGDKYEAKPSPNKDTNKPSNIAYNTYWAKVLFRVYWKIYGKCAIKLIKIAENNRCYVQKRVIRA